jgi:hypothetical protein
MTSDIARLRSLRASLDEMERPGPTADDSEAIATCRADIARIEEAWPDRRLLDDYARGSGESGDAEADALRSEIERRGLAV